jgi:hypothetical protein
MKRSVFLLTLLAGVLAGCAAPSQIRSEVTRFNQLPPSGGSVAIVAADERKSGGADFNRYAQVAASHLAAAGFPQPAGGEPDYIAELDYWQQPVAADSAPDDGPRVSIGIGNTSYGRHSAVGMGFETSFDVGGGDRGVTALRVVTLAIERRDSGARIFEGRSQNMGPAGNFPAAIPYMIDALFSGFPGGNGTTVTVDAQVDPDR